MGKRRRSVSSREEGDSETRQVGKDVKRKKHTFPFTNGLKHTSNTTVSFDCSGIPFPGDNIGTSLGFSKAVPSEREVNHCNQKHSRIAGRRGKPMSTVSRRKDGHAVPVRVTQHYFTSLDQNLKTSFLSTSSHNKVPFSISFEIAECCEIPLSEKVDSALDIKKSTKIRRSRRSRKRRKGSHCEQYMAYSSLQPQSYFCSNQSSTIRRPKILKALEDDVPVPAANKLVPSTEKEKYCLTNDVFDDSKNVCILPEVNLDSPNSSDIRTHQKEFNIERKKIKCLKNEVHENHNLDSASLHDSIIHRALRSPFRKKLLVLDLNGILCDVVFGSHGSCLTYKRVGMRSVFKRPFLDDFLAFCFQRFAVGIWSSRNKNNIIRVINYVMGDSKDRLLFCWDQSKCTYTGYNTIENKHKPLVLKELIKLWDKDEASLPWEKGEYSPSNTLLVDDSPYKALSNPPHSAIFPSPYDFRDKGDSVLGPDGTLRVYLESIAMAEDVQEHVKKHSFGQQAITPKHSMWSFYKNIIDKSKEISNEAEEVSLLKLEVEKKLVFRF